MPRAGSCPDVSDDEGAEGAGGAGGAGGGYTLDADLVLWTGGTRPSPAGKRKPGVH